MEVFKNLPYAHKPEIRERIEELFSRELLGAVLVGKFAGDYAAILTTDLLGTHVGYILGITLTIGLFIYWEKVARKAQKQKDKLNPAQTKIDDFD